MTATPDFPVLDTTRSPEHGRVIMDFFGYVEPHVDELDDWVSMIAAYDKTVHE